MCVVFFVTVLGDQLSASRLVTRFQGASECLSDSHTAMTLIYAEIFLEMEIQMTCLVLRVCDCTFWDENSDGLPCVFRLWDIFGPVFTELVSHWVVNALCIDDSCFVPKSFDRWLFDWFPQQNKTLFKFRCQDTSSNCRWQLAAVICRRGARKMWAGRYETNTLKDHLMLWALQHGGRWLVVWCFSYEQPLSVGIWNETLTVTSNRRETLWLFLSGGSTTIGLVVVKLSLVFNHQSLICWNEFLNSSF